ncbi:MAG: Flp pilus assembly complex ATPase component TadA [Gammaproteobacteria bacterium]|nr:Flp pilus assembly complex ATPase component TadA [Gammaproteobacteria bacterium]
MATPINRKTAEAPPAAAQRAERRAPRKQLGEFLVEKGLINRDQLRVALTEQRQKNERLGKILVRLGLVSESVVRDVLAEMLRVESIDLSKVVPDGDAVALLPEDVARRFRVLPIAYDPATRVLTVAMSDTFDVVALDQIAALLGGNIEVRTLLASEAEIQGAIEHFYDKEFSLAGILQEIDSPEATTAPLPANVGDDVTQPMVRLVDALLADAVKCRSSDIHLEPEDGFIRVRYRVDGVLRQVSTVHKKFWAAIAVRLKVMSGMDITETRAPQDGRISLSVGGRTVDFRVATQPTIHGENIVLRILDRRAGIVPIDKLGLPDDLLTLLKMLMARPEGVILVTGPTGSGKTTTLYSILNYRNDEAVNIMTLEDPVEYPFPMIRQTSLGEAVKLDFASGIRSLMRQDPDIILVGEIRDEATAEMAFRAAMTGHQVYSTLHTNSALGAIPRLLDIGLKPGILAGNIIGIIAQRLVRRLCPHCKVEYAPSEIERRLMGITGGTEAKICRSVGCEQCNNIGYRGRLSIMEIVRFDRDLNEALARGSSIGEMLALATSKGFRPLADDGIRRVLAGDTSLEEIARVVDLTERAIGVTA